jgi:hypothetical protein
MLARKAILLLWLLAPAGCSTASSALNPKNLLTPRLQNDDSAMTIEPNTTGAPRPASVHSS